MRYKNKKKIVYFKAILRNYINFPLERLKKEMVSSCTLVTLQRLPLKYCQILINNYCKVDTKNKNKHQQKQITKRLAEDVKIFDLYALQKMKIEEIVQLKIKSSVNKSLRRIIEEGFDFRILYFYKTHHLVYLYERMTNILNVMIGNEYNYYGRYSDLPKIEEPVLTKKQAKDIELLFKRHKIIINNKEVNNVR